MYLCVACGREALPFSHTEVLGLWVHAPGLTDDPANLEYIR